MYLKLFVIAVIVALFVREDAKRGPVGFWTAISTASAVLLGWILIDLLLNYADLLVDYGWPLLRTTLGQALARPW